MSNINQHSDESIENLKPLDLSELKGCVTDFDLFLDVAGKPVLYARGHYEWSPAEIEKLNHDGFSVLFYQKVNDDKVHNLRLARSDEEPATAEENTQDQELVGTILESYRDWIGRVDLPNQQMGQAVGIAEGLVQTVAQDPSMVVGFRNLSHHDSYSFYHSIRTAAYGAAIALELGCDEEQHLFDIVMGCLLHDIGHSQIDANILEKQGKLTDREMGIIRQHPRFALEMLQNTKLSPITTEIIMHHHEREDGLGYPHGIKGNEVIQEVKIVSFCDVFDALTSPRPYQNQMTFEQAIDFIEKNLLEYVDRQSFEALAKIGNPQKIKIPA